MRFKGFQPTVSIIHRSKVIIFEVVKKFCKFQWDLNTKISCKILKDSFVNEFQNSPIELLLLFSISVILK